MAVSGTSSCKGEVLNRLKANTDFCSAAQAWNRNDARAAKALSLRGQAENEAMRKAHREAANALYSERNSHLATTPSAEDEELYVDLHGLHPEEAIEYLEEILLEREKRGRRIIYAITGTGHHSKNGKDKVGKGVRNWLNEWGYTFREFSVPGERGGYIGGVLGVDITAHRRQPIGEPDTTKLDPGVPIGTIGGKIQLLKREEVSA
jgi:DNA-nicking Smr family endonuclease